MNLLIVIGVEKYKNLDDLPACFNDAKAIKEIICSVKELEQDEVLYLNSNEQSSTMKREIASFFRKHEGKTVDDLIFYFSGHGSRDQSDFYFLPNDYDEEKNNSTSFKNSELDDLVRSISPKNYIKIVDACYSGTLYIKADYDWESNFSKKINKLQLNNIYFWFSSGREEYSEAGKDFSYFTEALLTSILETELGEVRYVDISSKIADELKKYSQNPLFIEQAGKTELFGTIKEGTHSIIERFYGLDKDRDTIEEVETIQKKKLVQQYKLADEIRKKETGIFSNKDVLDLSESLNKLLSNKLNWSEDITSLFDFQFDIVERPSYIPNNKFIANWAFNNIDCEFYINFLYKEEKYKKKEYVKIPKKPSSVVTPKGRNSMVVYANQMKSLSNILGIPRDNDDYKLETVDKIKNVINGFEYYQHSDKEINEITLNPKSPLLNKIKIYTVLLYSHKQIVIFYSSEELRKIYWDVFSSPSCNTWKKTIISTKSNNFIEGSVNKTMQELSTWIISRVKGKLNS